MPFRSEQQRRFMFAKHPDIARRWAHEYGSKPVPSMTMASKRVAAIQAMRKKHGKKKAKKAIGLKGAPPQFGKGAPAMATVNPFAKRRK